MTSFILVFCGAGLGGCFRHAINLLALRWIGLGFPAGTLIINVTGSLAMGLLAGWFALKGNASQPWRLFLTTGVIAGYTTFSTFALDLVLLHERGQFGALVLYLLGSVGLSVGALVCGIWIIRLST